MESNVVDLLFAADNIEAIEAHERARLVHAIHSSDPGKLIRSLQGVTPRLADEKPKDINRDYAELAAMFGMKDKRRKFKRGR